MSVTGYAETLFGGLQADIKRVLTEYTRYILPNGRFGPVSHQGKSENFTAYYVNSTTPTSTGVEFSIVHGIGRAPYLAQVVIALDQVGVYAPVLKNSRAPDAMRVYFTAEAGSTNMPFSLLLE